MTTACIPPHGMPEIIRCFGNIEDSDFEAKNIVLFDLPYQMYFEDKPIQHARAHRLAVPYFQNALQAVLEHGLKHWAMEFGGIYNRRPMRGHPSLPSLHSWGIAIDLNPQEHPLGSDRRFPDRFIELWTRQGFTYGGDFTHRKDPMHFQLAAGV